MNSELNVTDAINGENVVIIEKGLKIGWFENRFKIINTFISKSDFKYHLRIRDVRILVEYTKTKTLSESQGQLFAGIRYDPMALEWAITKRYQLLLKC